MRRLHVRTFFVLSLVLLDACALILSFDGAYWTRFSWPFFLQHLPVTKGVPPLDLYRQTLWALLPMWLGVFSYVRLYHDQMESAYDEFVHVLKGVCLCAILTTAMSFAFKGVEYSRLVIGLWATFSTIFAFFLREVDKVLFRQLMLRTSGPQKVLVVGKGKALDVLRRTSQQQPFLKTFFLDSISSMTALEEELRKKQISELLLVQGSVAAQTILEAARLCEALQVDLKVVPDILEMRRGEIIFDGFCGLPTFQIKPASLYGTNYLLKRAFDVTVSLAILSVTIIPLLFISLLIRLDTPGPILFTQDRMGLRGRKFKVFKFRTMVSNADDYMEKLKHLSDRSGPVFKMKDDPRVTYVGNWLRKFSIDELPQILNVLTGDMSLVGPRPQVLWEAAHYDDNAKKRLRVMPGITGLWQVSGRASLSYEEMINLDIYYLENWSLGLDLKILLRTLPAIFAREGAY
jgi:exopolysaccharide biosynthesis polyprenyl glycosylphosphotransferase